MNNKKKQIFHKNKCETPFCKWTASNFYKKHRLCKKCFIDFKELEKLGAK